MLSNIGDCVAIDIRFFSFLDRGGKVIFYFLNVLYVFIIYEYFAYSKMNASYHNWMMYNTFASILHQFSVLEFNCFKILVLPRILLQKQVLDLEETEVFSEMTLGLPLGENWRYSSSPCITVPK